MFGRESLLDLNAAPVTVHVAEAPDIHQNVEAELLAGAEGPEHFVMLSSMAQSGCDDFTTTGLANSLNRSPNLAVGIMAVFV